MRNFEVGLGDDLIAKQQNVEVDCARAVAEACCAIAPEFAFDSEEAFKQRARGEFSLERDDCVYEVRLVGETYGFCGVE